MTQPLKTTRRIDRSVAVVIGVLLLTTAGLVSARLHFLDFSKAHLIPERVYTVDIVQSFSGHGAPVSLSVFLPVSDHRQHILDESQSSRDLRYDTAVSGGNRQARWQGDGIKGERTVTYTVKLNSRALRYEVDRATPLSEVASQGKGAYVEASDAIQSNHRDIKALAQKLLSKDGTVLGFLKNAYAYTRKLGFKAFKGETDALTALRLGEASCNGKSRLLVALLRSQHMAARLVGGLVMKTGTKRTSHQWVEVFIGGHWIPMDPTNNHFLEIPHHYLLLYRGDEVLFRHSSDIGFKYHFSVRKEMVPPQEIDPAKQAMGFYGVFQKLGIPMELLKSIIMIPLAAIVVIIFRNVIGLHTFGTFLPALIAIACRNTGLFWGIVGFMVMLGVVSLLRQLLTKLQLLHSPQLGVLLTAVIALLLFAAALGAKLEIDGLAKVSLFPMVIVAITAERFYLMEVEDGRLDAWLTLIQTLVVMSMAYVVMQSLSLQIIMLAFPELILVVVAINIWLGRWVGLRASEWIRFRTFLIGTPVKEGAR